MGFMDFFRKKNSGEVAKDRLKLLLISDRANCSPEIMEAIKNDIIKVITKYMDIDSEGSGYPDHPDRVGRRKRIRSCSLCKHSGSGYEKKKLEIR